MPYDAENRGDEIERCLIMLEAVSMKQNVDVTYLAISAGMVSSDAMCNEYVANVEKVYAYTFLSKDVI